MSKQIVENYVQLILIIVAVFLISIINQGQEELWWSD